MSQFKAEKFEEQLKLFSKISQHYAELSNKSTGDLYGVASSFLEFGSRLRELFEESKIDRGVLEEDLSQSPEQSPKQSPKPSPSADDKPVVQIVKQQATATRHLFLVRHAQYNDYGVNDESKQLTRIGRAQAKCVGNYLKSLCHKYDHITYTSLIRDEITAKLINEQLELAPEKMRSCDLIKSENPSPKIPKIVKMDSEISKGCKMVCDRAPIHQKQDSYEIYVCQGNSIRYFVNKALELPFEAWVPFPLHNASVTEIDIPPTGPAILLHLGEYDFLPPSIATIK